MGHGVVVRTGRTGGKGNCGQDVKKKYVVWFITGTVLLLSSYDTIHDKSDLRVYFVSRSRAYSPSW